jgi:hypothetical protein
MDSEPTIHTSSGSELEDRPRTMLLAHAECRPSRNSPGGSRHVIPHVRRCCAEGRWACGRCQVVAPGRLRGR